MSCFYAQPTCTPKQTKEHVISNAVLKVVFGNPIRNVVSANHLGDKVLIDNEPVIKDVCTHCNNVALSPYDVAGVSLVNQLSGHDATGLRLQVSADTFGWMLKTHLNHIRVIKDAEYKDVYPISQILKDGLIRKESFPHGQFKLYVEGWQGEDFYWDENDKRKIHWFQYRSIRFKSQRIVLSDFRIKTLTTWVLLPSDNDYESFDERASSVLAEVKNDFGSDLQSVDTTQAINDGYLDITQILSLESIKKFIYKKTS